MPVVQNNWITRIYRRSRRLARLLPCIKLNVPDDVSSISKQSPFIYENNMSKSLRFDMLSVQSSMYKDAPFELELGYTQTMMGFLLLNPAPRDILIVGLGGGSLPKYCYKHLPDCRITTVEINKEVISLRDKFAIPPDEERFSVVNADGAEYLAGRCNSADVIILDGYNAEGIPDSLASQHFFDQCALVLRDNGVLVSNLCQVDTRLDVYLSRLRAAFNNRVMKAKARYDCNKIVFAVKHDQMPQERILRDRAAALDTKHCINFSSIAAKMWASLRSEDQMRRLLEGYNCE
jgi:spermidine synthase